MVPFTLLELVCVHLLYFTRQVRIDKTKLGWSIIIQSTTTAESCRFTNRTIINSRECFKMKEQNTQVVWASIGTV